TCAFQHSPKVGSSFQTPARYAPCGVEPIADRSEGPVCTTAAPHLWEPRFFVPKKRRAVGDPSLHSSILPSRRYRSASETRSRSVRTSFVATSYRWHLAVQTIRLLLQHSIRSTSGESVCSIVFLLLLRPTTQTVSCSLSVSS